MISLCSSCQAVLPARANFCPNCGRTLNTSASPNAGSVPSRPVRTGIGPGRKWLIGLCLAVSLIVAILTVIVIENSKVILDETVIIAKSDVEIVYYGSLLAILLLITALIAAVRNPHTSQND